jgi:hypothetical protein
LTAGGSAKTGTDSCFSTGTTSQNHPIDPAAANIAPRTLTETLVTKPAKSNVTPKARTIGHAVGAGRFTGPAFSLTVDVNGSKAILRSFLIVQSRTPP